MFPIFFYPLFFELPAVIYLLFWALTQLFSGTLALAGPGSRGGRLVGARRRLRGRRSSSIPCSCDRGV